MTSVREFVFMRSFYNVKKSNEITIKLECSKEEKNRFERNLMNVPHKN